jgi:hypothetical protein
MWFSYEGVDEGVDTAALLQELPRLCYDYDGGFFFNILIAKYLHLARLRFLSCHPEPAKDLLTLERVIVTMDVLM